MGAEGAEGLNSGRYAYIYCWMVRTPWELGWSEKPKSWKSKNGQADY